MQATDYIWHNGKFVPWDDAKIHVLSHTLHYGGGAFEGIRVYRTDKGPAIFRLEDHIKRLFFSAETIRLKIPYSVEELINVVHELIRINRLEQGYIRPIAYYGYGKMGVNPIGAPSELAIACWPWGAYLPELIDVKTSEYIRIPPNVSAADAKLCGNYLNSIFAVLSIQGTRYHEALLLDMNGYIAEGPGENFFMIKNNVFYTPKLGNILAGVTRETVITIAKSLGYNVIEKNITLNETYEADEVFYTGTAAEVTPIRSIDDRIIGSGKEGETTRKIREFYLDVVYGRNENFISFLNFVTDMKKTPTKEI